LAKALVRFRRFCIPAVLSTKGGLVKKVFFTAALVLLSANSGFAFWNLQKVITHSKLPQPHILDKAQPQATELPDPSKLLEPQREAAVRGDDLGTVGTYACPIDLGKPYARSSAAGADGSNVDAKQCTGGMP
jgi:hypothetical protein